LEPQYLHGGVAKSTPLTELGLETGQGKVENEMRKLEPDSRPVWLKAASFRFLFSNFDFRLVASNNGNFRQTGHQGIRDNLGLVRDVPWTLENSSYNVKEIYFMSREPKRIAIDQHF